MRFEFLIGMRYLRARRQERFVSLIAVISLAGVMLGTFALSVDLAVMSGFEEDLHQRLLAFTSPDHPKPAGAVTRRRLGCARPGASGRDWGGALYFRSGAAGLI